MLNGIMNNAGTILISLLLAGMICAIIRKLRRDRKQGRSSCGGKCGCCPMAGSCHKQG